MNASRSTALARLAALALLAAPTPAASQTARSTQPTPSASPPAASSPSPSAPGAAALPPQAQSALKLAGLVTFVANACPKLQPNLARFLEAVQALGLTKADLDREELKGIYLGYAARYSADAKTSCERADAQFGPHGTTLAGIFDAR